LCVLWIFFFFFFFVVHGLICATGYCMPDVGMPQRVLQSQMKIMYMKSNVGMRVACKVQVQQGTRPFQNRACRS